VEIKTLEEKMKIRKIISVILAIVLVIGAIPMGTLTAIADDYPTLVLGEKAIAKIEHSGDTAIFEFTPTVTGTYFFYSDCEYDTKGVLYNSDWNTINENDDDGEGCNFKVQYKLFAGETYYFGASLWTFEFAVDIDVYLEKAVSSTGIVIDSEIKDYEGETDDINYYFLPENSEEETVTWTSSDESVATVDEGTVEFIKEGKAVITAESENGLKGYCSVTVLKPVVMTEDVPQKVTIKDNKKQVFEFTPSESGEYTFCCNDYSNSNEAFIDIYDSENYYINGDMNKLGISLEAGETYKVKTDYGSYSGTGNGSFDIIVSKSVSIESVEYLSNKKSDVYINDTTYARFVVKPWNAKKDEITWTSSDETVIRVGYRYSEFAEDGSEYGAYLESINSGKATITATFESGYEVEFEYTVRDYDVLTIGDVKSVNPPEYASTAYYYFTPAEDGCYAFCSLGNANLCGYIFDYYGSPLASNDDYGTSKNFRVKYKMTAGTTYKLGVTSATGFFNTGAVYVEKAKELKNIQIESLPTKTDYIKDYDYFNMDFEGLVLKATWEDDTVTYYDYEIGFNIDGEEIYFDIYSCFKDGIVRVLCGDLEVTYSINFIESPVDHIEIVTPPTREYIYGDDNYGSIYKDVFYLEPKDVTGLRVKVYYKDLTTKEFSPTGENGVFDGYLYYISYNPYDFGEEGEYPVTFKYLDASADYNITVTKSTVKSISVVSCPSVTEYDSNYAPCFIGTKVLIEYNDDTSKTVEFTEENIKYTSGMDFSSGVISYIIVDGYKLQIEKNGYDEINNFMVSYLGQTAPLNDCFSFDYKAIKDIEILSFNTVTKDFSVLLKYKNGESETLSVIKVLNQENYNGCYCYGISKNGIVYYGIDENTDFGISGDFYLRLFDKNIYLSSGSATVGDATGDDKIDAEDLSVMKAAILSFGDFYSKTLDINDDGNLDILDLVSLKKEIAKNI